MMRCLLAIFIFMASLTNAGSPLLDAVDQTNRVVLVNDGYEALLLRVHLFRHAQKSINVQTFILTNDECGRLFMYELIQAAKRGVKVRMIADHIASDKDLDLAAFIATAHPNFEFKYYRPAADRLKPSRLRMIGEVLFNFKRTNQRMHNKIITVDETIALTGGRNIENSYYHFSTGMNFKDRDVLVTGPVVKQVEASFNAFWNYRHSVSGRKLVDVGARIAANNYPRYERWEDFKLNGFFDALNADEKQPTKIKSCFVDPLLPVKQVEFICDTPGKNRKWGLDGDGRITKRLRNVLGTATNELIMQTPYLVVDPSAQEFFLALKQKRPALSVKVSSNSFGSTDNIMAYSANYKWRSLYIEELGLQIYEYKPLPGDLLSVFPAYPKMKALAQQNHATDEEKKQPFLCIHAKSFVMDENVAYIGTYNLDPRSANLNTEVGLLISDKRIAARLKQDILTDMAPQNSWVIAKKQQPMSVEKMNTLFERLSNCALLDLWPIRNTSSFELIPGKTAVPPGHPEFYQCYEDKGAFPGDQSPISPKAAQTRMLKIINSLAAPIL